MMIVIVISFCF